MIGLSTGGVPAAEPEAPPTEGGGRAPLPTEAITGPGDSSRLRILRLDNDLGWESAPYNQFTLPARGAYDITYSTYFPVPLAVADGVELAEGKGTLRPYLRDLRDLLRTRFDIVHAHTVHVAVLYLLAKSIYGDSSGARTVYTFHNSFPNYRVRNKLLLFPVCAGFDRIVCCSRASLASLPSLYRGVAGDRLRAIQNGVDTARIDRVVDSVMGAESREFTVIGVGRLIPIKNHPTMIRAFSESNLTNARLRLIGEGPLRDELARTVASEELEDRVQLLGRVSRDQVFREAAQADLFVSTSFGEGLPVAVLEVMASGCPVVLSDIEPHREIARGVNFVPLVDSSDAAGFAREMRRIQELDEEARMDLGRRCRELVRDRFGLEKMLREYDALYRDLLDRETSP